MRREDQRRTATASSGKRIRIVLGVLLLACAVSGTALAGVEGSVHDFTDRLWSSGELCDVCHTPHDADATVPQAPLWNHEVTVSVFTLYSSSTMDVVVGQPVGVSRLCLSCHDGTVAVDSYGNMSGSDFDVPSLGTDLSDDHPISIQWQHQTVEPGSDALCQNCHFDPGPVPFFNGRVECASCHDVHDTEAQDIKLLRLPISGSPLCLHCHEK